jgi:hypothetical protein
MPTTPAMRPAGTRTAMGYASAKLAPDSALGITKQQASGNAGRVGPRDCLGALALSWGITFTVRRTPAVARVI